MNDDSNYDKLVRAMKEIPVRETETAAPQVMDRIRAYERAKRTPVRKSLRIRVWAAAMLLLVITAISVQGMPRYLFHWNGMDITTYKPEPQTNPSPDAYPPYTERIENELAARRAEYRTLTLEEAQKESPFPLMRPANLDMKPSRTFGVATTPLKKPAAKDEPYMEGFYDFYEQGETWIVVRQIFDPQRETEGGVLMHYPEDWEVVKVSDRIMSVYHSENNFAIYSLYIVTDEKDTIWLSLTGNVSKKKLETVAEAYIGRKLTGNQ